MVTISNFTWTMTIDFGYLCKCIQENSYRKEGIKVVQMRKLYKLICCYGNDDSDIKVRFYLNHYPKAKSFFQKGEK